jgi:hypothetical protein
MAAAGIELPERNSRCCGHKGLKTSKIESLIEKDQAFFVWGLAKALLHMKSFCFPHHLGA